VLVIAFNATGRGVKKGVRQHAVNARWREESRLPNGGEASSAGGSTDSEATQKDWGIASPRGLAEQNHELSRAALVPLALPLTVRGSLEQGAVFLGACGLTAAHRGAATGCGGEC